MLWLDDDETRSEQSGADAWQLALGLASDRLRRRELPSQCKRS